MAESRPTVLRSAVPREFYESAGLSEKWLRQEANRRTHPLSKARTARVRSMPKLAGLLLAKVGVSHRLS